MAVTKIIELVGSSTRSSDDAVQQALAEARRTLRNIKAVDVVSTGLRGDALGEWRAHGRLAVLLDSGGEKAHKGIAPPPPRMGRRLPRQGHRPWQGRAGPPRHPPPPRG